MIKIDRYIVLADYPSSRTFGLSGYELKISILTRINYPSSATY